MLDLSLSLLERAAISDDVMVAIEDPECITPRRSLGNVGGVGLVSKASRPLADHSIAGLPQSPADQAFENACAYEAIRNPSRHRGETVPDVL